MTDGRSGVIDKDLGWKEIKRQVSEIGQKVVKVGFQTGTKTEKGFSLPMVAAVLHYGSSDGRIPERPFMSNAFQKNQDKIRHAQEALVDKIYKGKLTTDKALHLLGQQHVGQVQREITEFKSPGNAKSTVRIKGFDNPLIHHGRMKRSVSEVVVSKWEKDSDDAS